MPRVTRSSAKASRPSDEATDGEWASGCSFYFLGSRSRKLQFQYCQLGDGDDADASIGIGLQGQSTSVEMGAGWTEYFASGAGTCSPNSKTFKKIWVSVAMIPTPGNYNVYHLYRWHLDSFYMIFKIMLSNNYLNV